MKYAIIQGYDPAGQKRYAAAFFEDVMEDSKIAEHYTTIKMEIVYLGNIRGSVTHKKAHNSPNPLVKIIVDEVYRANTSKVFDVDSLEKRLAALSRKK
ncbi:hypothetical protein J4207_02705 [Candidatus Woesearchaeota archaeon]|nr:hypothetical protein [Candidatus Woesearchaeota archaeon]